jgi:type II secretory pathway component PulJ
MRAFTLLEVIIYLALFSMIMGGAAVSVFYIFDAADRAHTESVLENESDFILGKIDWMLSSAESITTPIANSSGSTLTIVSLEPTLDDPVSIFLQGSNVSLTHGTHPQAILNSIDVSVTSLTYSHHVGSGIGYNPEYIETVLTLSARTKTGREIYHTATGTSYVKK